MNEWKRPSLNLVVVLDISGSMSSPFNCNGSTDNLSKMEVSKQCLLDLLKQLTDIDQFGLVLFDHAGYVKQELQTFGKLDKKALTETINGIQARGGTNFGTVPYCKT